MPDLSRPNADVTTLTPQMQAKVAAFMRLAHDHGLSIRVFEARRSKERQAWLYAQGRTRPGVIVTWTLQSRHITGEAVDIVFVDPKGNPTWTGDWKTLIAIGKSVGLDNLSPAETSHFQDNLIPMPTQETTQAIPAWANETVTLMHTAGITTDPTTPVGTIPVYQLLTMILKFVRALK